jgi:hypothetical protein
MNITFQRIALFIIAIFSYTHASFAHAIVNKAGSISYLKPHTLFKNIPLAVNSKSMDDDLCSVLMRSQVGEDEAQLAVQPLNVLYPCAEKELEFPDWVIKCAERIHSRVGITYIGHKWQFMALLIFIERERLKELEAQSLSVSKRNREIKNLESSINYDNRGDGKSSRGKRKGRGSKAVL